MLVQQGALKRLCEDVRCHLGCRAVLKRKQILGVAVSHKVIFDIDVLCAGTGAVVFRHLYSALVLEGGMGKADTRRNA